MLQSYRWPLRRKLWKASKNVPFVEHKQLMTNNVRVVAAQSGHKFQCGWCRTFKHSSAAFDYHVLIYSTLVGVNIFGWSYTAKQVETYVKNLNLFSHTTKSENISIIV